MGSRFAMRYRPVLERKSTVERKFRESQVFSCNRKQPQVFLVMLVPEENA